MRPETRRAGTALYRMFNEAGELLYVGITAHLGARWDAECRQVAWWPDVRRQTVVWYASRTEAEAAEKAAIQSEKPIFNKLLAKPVRNAPKTATRTHRTNAYPATGQIRDWIDI
jgi:hypothetical protein